MKKIPIHQYLPEASQIVFGCMGLGGEWDDSPLNAEHYTEAEKAIEIALEAGINFFDHADIYTRGKAEQVFGQYLKSQPAKRDQIIIQSKAGIRLEEEPAYYDFSTEWLRARLERSLQSLNIDYLDVWLLHRPDPLMDPEELAELFTALKQEGKVRFFGLSNMHLHQIQFLQKHLSEPLIVNQVEMSLGRLDWLHEGVTVGDTRGKDVNFTSGTIEHCRDKGIQLQAWGSLAQGIFSGKDVSFASERVQKTAALVSQLGEKYECSPEGIVLAWLMRHPAHIQPMIGTTNPKRILACTEANKVNMERRDWYNLYISAYGQELP